MFSNSFKADTTTSNNILFVEVSRQIAVNMNLKHVFLTNNFGCVLGEKKPEQLGEMNGTEIVSLQFI